MKQILITLTITLMSVASFGQVPEPVAEDIYGFTYNAEGITFQVFSGGCTNKDSFRIEVLESHPLQLRLVRKDNRVCMAEVPYGTQVAYTWEEVGIPHSGTEFTIWNKIKVGVYKNHQFVLPE